MPPPFCESCAFLRPFSIREIRATRGGLLRRRLPAEQSPEFGDDRIDVAAVVGDAGAVARWQVLHLALAGGELGLSDNNGRAKALAVGVLKLLAQLLRLGIDFHANAGSAKLGGELEIIVAMAGVEQAHQHGRRRLGSLQPAELL